MASQELRIEDLWACFDGIIPANIATCARDGTPNISFISQVYYVDSEHLALSFQFFNKTRRNIEENPFACLMMIDPRDFQSYRAYLRYERSEASGPLFDSMSLQLQSIASYGGMSDVFRLRAADVYRVLRIERLSGFTSIPEAQPTERIPPLFVDRDLAALKVISEQINRAEILSDLLEESLRMLDGYFGFRNTMILLADERERKLLTIYSRGYDKNGAGSEVRYGEGLIGMVAVARRALRLCNLQPSLSYARAVRERAQEVGGPDAVGREIPLPGLADVSSQVAVPLLARGRLVGVLVAEGTGSQSFQPREETLLAIVGTQLAAGIEQLGKEAEDAPAPGVPAPARPPVPESGAAMRRVCFFHADDCVFVDGEYLIRNVPGRILWRILRQNREEGRTEFNNRELRMDSWLGLPEVKDNLEARLILLRKRLEQKCPEIRLVSCGRGRFTLELDCALDLSEKR